MVAKSETIRLGGRDIEYRWVRGAGHEAPVILMLHEGLGSVSTWRDFPEAVGEATGGDVLVYSRYGYGRSSVRKEAFSVDYMHHAALEELPPLLEALEVESSVLFGHSDGASIALIYAGNYPANALGLIVEAPHVFTEQVSVDSIAAIQKVYESSDDLRHRLGRHHADPDASFYGWNAAWQLPEFIDWNIEEYLPQITCPALVVQGEGDEYGTLDQVNRIDSGSGGRVGRLILGECGHAPHRDQKDAVLAATKEFVEAL